MSDLLSQAEIDALLNGMGGGDLDVGDAEEEASVYSEDDVEEMEELARALRAFRDAQRAMLDQLSAGVAQFDAKRQMVFANPPFQRIFALSNAAMFDLPPFERLRPRRLNKVICSRQTGMP